VTPAETQLLAWLRTHTTRWDRTLADALNMGTVELLERTPLGWRIVIKSKREVEHRIMVTVHPITGDPTHYYRERLPPDA
jgi:hypothetical protein